MSAAMAATADAAAMIDLDRYPIDDLETPAGRAFVQKSRAAYEAGGACLLRQFVRPAALAALAAEARSVSHVAYYCDDNHTAYLTAGLTAGAAAANNDDPADRLEKTSVGSVAYDRLPADGALRRLYRYPPLKTVIAAVLGKPVLHYFADPLGACSINVFRDGGQHGWHFDESEFTVTLMLQQPVQGGAFEYVPKIRGTDREREEVRRALDGSSDKVHHLPFSPGALLIFAGRQTLHRVTRVSGDRLRLVPVLCYSETPGAVNSDAVRRLFWGRTGDGSVHP